MGRWSDRFIAASQGVSIDIEDSEDSVKNEAQEPKVSAGSFPVIVSTPKLTPYDVVTPEASIQATVSSWFERFRERGSASKSGPVNVPLSTDPVPVSSVITNQNFLVLDFETRNTYERKLDDVGTWRYAEDPATEILTLTYRDPEGDTWIWSPANGRCERLATLAADPAVVFVCFADFEPVVWDRIMVRRFGFPAIPTSRWVNAQATCAYLTLPGALDGALTVIGAPVVKDAAGRNLVLSLSRPNRKTKLCPKITPEIFARVAAYNRRDIDGLAAVHAAVGDLPEAERRVWEMDQAINARGVHVDVDFARAGKALTKTIMDGLKTEYAMLTAGSGESKDEPIEGLTPQQVDKTRKWLGRHGFPLENLQEKTVQYALDKLELPNDVRRVLEIRQIVASTSLSKFDAMLDCVGFDDRARGLYRYHGANPGRWTAHLFQPQNLPRPTVDIPVAEIEDVVVAVKTGNPKALDRWTDKEKGLGPIDVLASSLRFAIVAGNPCATGNSSESMIETAGSPMFGVGDFSMIETCVLLALAGQRDKCELIANGVDIYRDMGSIIHHLDRDTFIAIPKHDLTVEQSRYRQDGKNAVLGCGYYMGPERFQTQYCKHLSNEEGLQFAKDVVYTHYRQNWAPMVPQLWNDIGRTARIAMRSRGRTITAKCGISYRRETIAGLPCLTCQLFNGKELHYMDVKFDELSDKGDWIYKTYKNKHWVEVAPHPGHLTENVVQALARELLVDAMLRFEARGFPIVMHCHDEIVVEHPDITKELIEEIMAGRPQWAIDLDVPIAVEAWVGTRYRK
jgi:DNA polymerase